MDVSVEPRLAADEPERLFDFPYFRAPVFQPRSFDLAPDGQSFVVIREGEPPPADWYRVVQNFFVVLREVAPAQR